MMPLLIAALALHTAQRQPQTVGADLRARSVPCGVPQLPIVCFSGPTPRRDLACSVRVLRPWLRPNPPPSCIDISLEWVQFINSSPYGSATVPILQNDLDSSVWCKRMVQLQILDCYAARWSEATHLEWELQDGHYSSRVVLRGEVDWLL